MMKTVELGLLCIENNGGDIHATNYWQSDYAKEGYLLLTYNAREFRLLLPPALYRVIPDMRKGAKAFVVSVLHPKNREHGKAAAEFLVEDASNTPFTIHLASPQLLVMPDESAVGKQLTASVWREKHGQPKCLMRRPAVYQIVPKLPWLRRTGAEHLYKQWQKARRGENLG